MRVAKVKQKNGGVWTVRDGRIVRAEFYPSGRAEVLASVGLAA